MKTAHKVYLGIGSNLDRKHNISSCLNILSASFKQCVISPIYQSAAQGFDGEDFYNVVVQIATHFECTALKSWLIKLEDQHKRDRSLPRFANKTLDIDILLFDDDIINQRNLIIPRIDVLKQAYVLKPLSDIAGQMKHPVTKKTFQQHWREMANQQKPKLIRLDR